MFSASKSTTEHERLWIQQLDRRRAITAYASVIAATLIWGTIHPVGKIILRDATSLQLVLVRSLLTSITLIAYLAIRGNLGLMTIEMHRRPWRIVGLGLLSFFASSGLSMTGLQFLPASVNSLLANTSPLMLAIGSVVLFRRIPRPRIALGLLLGFSGVGLLTFEGMTDLGAIGVVGVLLSLGGSLTWAIYTAWSRGEMQFGDPIAITAAASLVGSAPFLLITMANGQLQTLPSLPTTTLLWLIYAGVIGTALTYALWMTALRHLSATNVAAFQYVIPLNAVSISVLALGEPLTFGLIVGGMSILAGVALAQERVTATVE